MAAGCPTPKPPPPRWRQASGPAAAVSFLTVGTDYCYVIAGDFVSTADGTGIVHIAPGCGDDTEMTPMARPWAINGADAIERKASPLTRSQP